MEGKYLQQYNENMQLLTVAIAQGDLKSGFVHANKALLTFGNSQYADLFNRYREMVQLMNHGKKRRIRRSAKKMAKEIRDALERKAQSCQTLINNLEELGEE